jgi:hypothetical protein
VDLLRRLSCTGWVLLISQEASFARVVVALGASLAVLLGTAVASPYRREEDNWLGIFNQLATVIILMCVEIIRVVDARHVINAEQAKDILGFNNSMPFFIVIIFLTFSFVGANLTSGTYVFVKTLKQNADDNSAFQQHLRRTLGRHGDVNDLNVNGIIVGGIGLGFGMGAVGAVIAGLVGGVACGFTFCIVGSVLGGVLCCPCKKEASPSENQEIKKTIDDKKKKVADLSSC